MISPDLQYTVLCDDVRREDNGKLMALGIFEHIGAPVFPFIHPRLCILNKWCNGEGNWTQQTRIVDEDDQVLIQNDPVKFSLETLESHFLAVQIFGNIQIPHAGRIWIEVLLNGELKQRYVLQVSQS
ncbi:MAG TPA: hypothetical protein VF681_12970 [Abditibacteriaceae bacterium]|jgi:hypothetical protein